MVSLVISVVDDSSDEEVAPVVVMKKPAKVKPVVSVAFTLYLSQTHFNPSMAVYFLKQ